MKKFTETEIQKILNDNESGVTLRELSRKYGVNRNTISNWKQKYGGMEFPICGVLKNWKMSITA